MNNIKFGCSGWDYDDWKGTLYKSNVKSKLKSYTAVFNTAEINSTFYRLPSQGMVFGWLKHTPMDFVFSAKIPKTVTHDKKLIDTKEDIDKYCELMKPLNDTGKLRCSLIQLPPRLKFNKEITKKFFQILPENFQFAIEFRNHSWMCDEAWNLLKEFNVAYVIVDEPLLPSTVKVTAKISYIRWHGHGEKTWYNYRYSEKELKEWLPKIKEVTAQCETTFGYFNNHFHGYAPENCLDVLEMLGVISPHQQEMRKTIKEGIKKWEKGEKIIPKTLDFFAAQEVMDKKKDEKMKDDQIMDDDLKSLILTLSDESRIARAKEINKHDISIQKITNNYLRADIKNYRLIIDLKDKTIRHNCIDYYRGINKKRLCKHIIKLLTMIPKDVSKMILSSLTSNLESWEFKRYWEKEGEEEER